MKTHPFQHLGRTFIAGSEKTLYLPDQDTLLAADIHLGKAETFQHFGLAVPSGAARVDLQRLADAVQHFDAKRLIILGDLVHAAEGVTQDLIQLFANFRPKLADELILIRGNHDRALERAPDSWRMEVVPEVLPLGDLLLRHHPEPAKDFYVLAGHVHPVVLLKDGRDALRLPCFHFTDNLGYLPAFSSMAGGFAIQPEPGTQTIVTAGDDLVPLDAEHEVSTKRKQTGPHGKDTSLEKLNKA